MSSSGILNRVALVRTDVSEELSASVIKVTRIRELGTTLAVINLLTFLVHRFSLPWRWWRYFPPKHRWLQEPHGITSQKTAFFIVTYAKSSKLTLSCRSWTLSYSFIYLKTIIILSSLTNLSITMLIQNQGHIFLSTIQLRVLFWEYFKYFQFGRNYLNITSQLWNVSFIIDDVQLFYRLKLIYLITVLFLT
jgi:hypothetical protein